MTNIIRKIILIAILIPTAVMAYMTEKERRLDKQARQQHSELAPCFDMKTGKVLGHLKITPLFCDVKVTAIKFIDKEELFKIVSVIDETTGAKYDLQDNNDQIFLRVGDTVQILTLRVPGIDHVWATFPDDLL